MSAINDCVASIYRLRTQASAPTLVKPTKHLGYAHSSG
jgi:hypothetical protein